MDISTIFSVMNVLTAVSCASVYPPAFYPLNAYQPAIPTPFQPVVSARQGILGNLVNTIGTILNQGSQDRQDNQRPDGDGSGIKPEDAQAIWISGFPIRRTLPGILYI